ncbi:MAG: HNH endonuclease [bacterium]|nr:HNH endonuclease [bacterium]
MINDLAYPPTGQSQKYDERYKTDDIKTALNDIYHGKCAFCETKSESMHVEHFRPKRGGYYWLAYSWDNLLLSCPTCNTNKGDDFPLAEGGMKACFVNTDDNIRDINVLSGGYDQRELPLLVNPETATNEELGALVFTKGGNVSSSNPRMSQTISHCKLQRVALCQKRKDIWDDLCREIRCQALCNGKNKETLANAIKGLIMSFKQKSIDKDAEFLAFRKYIVVSTWIKDELMNL